jgi:hypothetical protein
MILNILFGQRKCRYDGEYAHEALEVADELVMEENPDWIIDCARQYTSNPEFESAAILVVRVDDAAINACLFPNQVVIDGEVVG